MRTPENKPQPETPQGGRSSKRRKVKLPKYSRLNKEVIKALDTFLESTSAKRLSRNLRDLFFYYMAAEENDLPEDFKELPTDLFFLLQFLDIAAEELPEA